MTRLAPALLSLLLLLAAGCNKPISDQEANAVIREIAAELVAMEAASTDARMEKVTAACNKQKLDVKGFAAYLKEHPDVEQRLVAAMQESFQKEFDAYTARKEQEIRTLAADPAALAAKADLAAKLSELKQATDQDLEKMQADFNQKRQALLKEIDALKAQN
jgi:hypothetical protein